MELLKNPYVAAIIIVVCAVMVYLANRGDFFGKFINTLAPCTQNPAASFPCYGIYDIVIMVLAGIIGAIFLIVLMLRLFGNAQS